MFSLRPMFFGSFNSFMSSRARFMICLGSSIGALGIVLILQLHKNLTPCPLCILQRIGLLWAAFWFLLGALHRSPTSLWTRTYWIGAVLGLLFGFSVALRQIWLQHLPPDLISSTCTPSLFYAAKYLPFSTFWHLLFDGSGSFEMRF